MKLSLASIVSEVKPKPDPAILTFGKHRGEHIGEVPLSYVSWILDKCDSASPALKKLCREILDRGGEPSKPASYRSLGEPVATVPLIAPPVPAEPSCAGCGMTGFLVGRRCSVCGWTHETAEERIAGQLREAIAKWQAEQIAEWNPNADTIAATMLGIIETTLTPARAVESV